MGESGCGERWRGDGTLLIVLTTLGADTAEEVILVAYPPSCKETDEEEGREGRIDQGVRLALVQHGGWRVVCVGGEEEKQEVRHTSQRPVVRNRSQTMPSPILSCATSSHVVRTRTPRTVHQIEREVGPRRRQLLDLVLLSLSTSFIAASSVLANSSIDNSPPPNNIHAEASNKITPRPRYEQSLNDNS